MIFITASHKPEILEANLLKSKIFKKYKLIVQKNYSNVPKAYNEAEGGDITVYVHHDVFLPDDFEDNLLSSIAEIEKKDKNWGVLGVAGVELKERRVIYGNIDDRGVQWGDPKELPHEVDTLDELILIVKNKFVFDEKLGNHFYGADICLQAKELGMKSYAINAYLHHNSGLLRGERPDDFWEARDYMKEKYKHILPIATTCTIIN